MCNLYQKPCKEGQVPKNRFDSKLSIVIQSIVISDPKEVPGICRLNLSLKLDNNSGMI